MVRRRVKIIGGGFLGATLLLLCALGWLLGSREGAVWLLARIDGLDGVQVVATVDGTLWSGLELHDLDGRWPGGRVDADRLQLAWQPLRLLTGEMQVERLEIGRIRIESGARAATGTTSTPGLSWPARTSWLAGARIAVEAFSADQLSLVEAGGQALVLDALRGSATLAQGVLRVQGLHAVLPCGTADGALEVDLARRALAADLLWRGAPIVADWDTVSATLSLGEALRGPLRVELRAADLSRLQLQADAVLGATGVALHQLVVARSDAADRLTGSLQVGWAEALQLTVDVQLQRLNLLAETGHATDLSGTLQATLDGNGFRGEIDLENGRPGLERGRLAATVEGDWQGLRLADLDAAWLDGEVAGDLELDWRKGFRLAGALHGDAINLSNLVPELTGRLRMDLDGGLQITPQGELQAEWDARLGPSELQNRPLSGRVAGQWRQNDLTLEALDLHGDGLRVRGGGRLSRRIDLQLQADDLSRIGRGWQGRLTAQAWLARRHGEWISGAHGDLQQVRVGRLEADAGQFELDYGGRHGLSHVALTLERLRVAEGTVDRASLSGSGTLDDHTLDLRLAWRSGSLAARLSGGWQASAWSGRLQEASGTETLIGDWQLVAPARLVLGRRRVIVGDLQLAGSQGGELALAADLVPAPLAGTVRSDWQGLPLRLLDPWLGGPTLGGTASGELQLDIGPAALSLVAEIAAAPLLRWQGRELAFSESRARIDLDAAGLQAEAELNLLRGGRWMLKATSPQGGRAALPQQGELDLSWQDVELQQFSPWLPSAVSANGHWFGQLAGRWLDGGAPQLSGRTWVDAGELQWQETDGLITLPLRQAELTGDWQAGWVEGDLRLALADRGQISATFRLPVGLAEPRAPLQAEAHFALDELGLLLLLMPGVSNEHRGQLQGDLRLAGTRLQPQLFGRFSLRGAGADIPALGLKLREAELDVAFDQSTVTLERLHLVSGSGRLEGEGALQLTDWRPQRWHLNLKGDQLELVNLPEIRLEASPDLRIDRTPQRLRVGGTLQIPRLLIDQLPKNGAVEPSEDVVFAEANPKTTGAGREPLELKVQVALGEQVVVKAKGLDARLEGGVTVTSDARGGFVGQGEIRVRQGHYAAYGLKLPISRGRATFSGGAVQDPVLDVLAERKVGEIRAGVQVTGTPRKPRVVLVSTPAMPDTEILSYIVLGRPLGAPGEQNQGLMLAAGALLSRGESAALQEKLRRRIGIDVLEVQNRDGDGVEGSMVAVGKYLTPDLYLSFGRALFSEESVATLRYQIGKRWELESQFGTVSGADLSYRIEFR